MEKKLKESEEARTKHSLDIKGKESYLKQIRHYGSIPETFEEELGKSIQKIVSMEHEMQQLHRHLNETIVLYEDKLMLAAEETRETQERELKCMKKITELNERLRGFTDKKIEENHVSFEM